MKIDVKIKKEADPKEKALHDKIKKLSKKPATKKIKLRARKTLDGNVLISDHEDIDIAIMPSQSKIIAFAKDNFEEYVYDAQDKLFKFLSKKGIIDPSSVQGGNVFMSMEAKLVQSEDYNVVQASLLNISKFIDEEKPSYLLRKAYEEEEERRLTEPDPEDSTEFDPNRHKSQKGSMRPNIRPYGISSIYRI